MHFVHSDSGDHGSHLMWTGAGPRLRAIGVVAWGLPHSTDVRPRTAHMPLAGVLDLKTHSRGYPQKCDLGLKRANVYGGLQGVLGGPGHFNGGRDQGADLGRS